jgi:photosystem II stability/assembly factor-like uncharacterized protein
MWRFLTGALLTSLVAGTSGCGDAALPTSGTGTTTGSGPTGGHMWALGERGLMASAFDGVTIAERPAPAAATLHALVCVDDQLAWAVGEGGTILSTHNGGFTWQAQTSAASTTLWGAAFSDAGRGYAVGAGGLVLRTTDAGVHWTPVALPVPPTAVLRAVSAASSGGLVLVVGDGGLVLRSVDGGVRFDVVAGPTSAGLRAVRLAEDELRAVTVGDGGAVWSSADGGASWRAEVSAPGDLRGVSLSDDHVIAVGARGLVWRRARASEAWSQVAVGAVADLNAVKFDRGAPAFGWIVGAGGTVLFSNDQGAHFRALPTPVGGTLTAVEDF